MPSIQLKVPQVSRKKMFQMGLDGIERVPAGGPKCRSGVLVNAGSLWRVSMSAEFPETEDHLLRPPHFREQIKKEFFYLEMNCRTLVSLGENMLA